MFKFTTRIAPTVPISRAIPRARAARRFISTAPPHQQSRSWRSSTARWGLAGALVYYYNTVSVFAEEPQYAVHAPPETSREDENYQTVASISEERKAQARSQAAQASKPQQSANVSTAVDGELPAPGSPEALEEEASEQGAFNEETGEINWDCPCLGGMAYGPCGEQFRAAFSCFVFSQEEPKGVDCIEHFKTMQNCFREHPDIYGQELEDDEEGAEATIDGDSAPIPSEPTPHANVANISSNEQSEAALAHPSAEAQDSSTPTPKNPVSSTTTTPQDSDDIIPKAAHDARDST